MHHAAPDEIVILAVIEDGEADHPRIFDGPPHEFVVLDAMSVVGDGDDAGLRE